MVRIRMNVKNMNSGSLLFYILLYKLKIILNLVYTFFSWQKWASAAEGFWSEFQFSAVQLRLKVASSGLPVLMFLCSDPELLFTVVTSGSSLTVYVVNQRIRCKIS